MQLSSPRTIQNNLKPYINVYKTIRIQYQIILLLLKGVKVRPQIAKTQTFISLYINLSGDIRNLPLYEYLNYRLWSDQSIPLQVRQKTRFFHMVSNWIVAYELKVGKLGRYKGQFKFLLQFFQKQTKNIFQKIILFDQIYDDLTQFICQPFWKNTNIQNQQEILPDLTDAQQIIKFLSTIVYYQSITLSNSPTIHDNCLLSLILTNMHHYNQFMLNSIKLVLSIKGLQSADQTQISRIALVFLQRPMLKDIQVINLIKMLMVNTSKPVRFALIIDYVKFYDYLQKSGQDVILQQLQDIIYFRQLIIGRQQIDQAGLLSHTLGPSLQKVRIPARSKHRVYISQQPSFGSQTIIQMEILVQGPDINIALFKIQKDKQSLHWKQQKSQDRRVDILIKQTGLYALQFDNTYSWLKAKGVSFKIQQFKSNQSSLEDK